MSAEFLGHVLAPESLGPCRVVVEGERIAAILPAPDAPEGTWIVPGLVDIQLNGAFGVDFAVPEPLDVVRARIAATGVTTFLATLVSAPPGSYADPLAALVPDTTPGLATLAGVHLEGPGSRRRTRARTSSRRCGRRRRQNWPRSSRRARCGSSPWRPS